MSFIVRWDSGGIWTPLTTWLDEIRLFEYHGFRSEGKRTAAANNVFHEGRCWSLRDGSGRRGDGGGKDIITRKVSYLRTEALTTKEDFC